MDFVTLVLSKKYTDKKIAEVAAGFRYKGAVNKFTDLPTNAQVGDIYTVKFKNDGTTPWNAEFVWGNYEGTKQWIELGTDYSFDIEALKTGKQDKLTAGSNITIDENNVISATGGVTPQYIELSFYEDGQTGTLTNAQAQILLNSELNYIWLNGMHRLDFRYRDDNNNKATYSAVDTSSDGNKTHSVEINLSTKAFKVYHRTLQEKLTAGTNVAISTSNVISVEAQQLQLSGTSGTLTTAQLALLENKSVTIVRDNTIYKLSNITSTSSGPLRTYDVVMDNNVAPMYHFIIVNMLSGAWSSYETALQEKLTAGTNITIDEATNTISATGGAEYFLAEFNVTPFADVLAAYNAGKIMDVKATMTSIGDVSMHLKFVQFTGDTPTSFSFSQLIADTASMTVSVDAGGWHSTQIDLERELVAGSAVAFTRDIGTARTLSVKYDNDTIKLNSDGKLYTTASGTSVIANPTLSGGEAELTSIQIGDTKYSNLNYHPFPSDFKSGSAYTLQEFGQSIVKYAGFATGCVWFGGLQNKDLPGNMMQVECKVTALRDKTDFVRNIAVIEIFSSEVAPFYWTYNTDSWEKGTGLDDWKYVAEIDESKFDSTAAVNTSYGVKVKKVSSAANSTGWEFYPEKLTEVIANPTLAGTEASLSGLQVGDTKYKVATGTGTTNFNDLTNRPSYNGLTMTGLTSIPEVKTAIWDAKQDAIDDLDTIRSGAALGATAIQEHQDISGKVDKPNEPVVGQGLNVPYYFDVNYAADKVTVKDYTVDLLNKDKAPQQFSIDINAATQANAGLMSAADKTKLDTYSAASATVGGANKGIYLNNGAITTTTYSVDIDVPADAKFTDTTYEVATTTTDGLMSAADKVALGNKQDALTAGDGISIANNTISVDDTIAKKQELPNFRGNWDNWTAVPTDSSLYPADFTGSKVPTTNDYLVVENANDLINPNGEIDFTKQYSITRNANSAVFTLTDPSGETTSVTHVNDGVTVKYLGKNNEFIIKSIGNAEWTIKCTHKVSYNGTVYQAGNVIVTTMYYDKLNAKMYLPESYKDTWQFRYAGVWATDGKNGWKIDYQPAWSLPSYPTDTSAEYILGLKYENGAWKKYWKETINRSDVVDRGMVDYMVIKQ